ncbi:MAG: indolepyruvate oxidoreductase subunit beta family protein [Gammaproteobacteria bacterium]|nr:indolepyruvate oxidoreductase subunit beta family protein [Gammaproteobacteria bacterium]
MNPARSINIAILAIGGQGGGVMAEWLVEVAERAGYRAQYTSVPGVAQRTGATIYYLELFPERTVLAAGKEPVLALMPVPGDVDVVVAAELMEAGRALLRGLVTPERTTLIASTHRVYAISEKSAPGDGRGNAFNVIEAARTRAKRFIGLDMDQAARRGGSVISAAMFGALAGSDALPIPRALFEDVIRAGGRAVEANLKTFAIAFDGAAASCAAPPVVPATSVVPATAGAIAAAPAVQPLLARIETELPGAAHAMAREGLRRVIDFQDLAYGELYLDRLRSIAAVDRAAAGAQRRHALVVETARHLALWMSFEDTFRVADLKTRGARFERVRSEVGAAPGQVVDFTEFMRPRIEEVCDSLPAPIGRFILGSPALKALLRRPFGKGRQIRTSRLGGFLTLYLLGQGRRIRRSTLRFKRENAAIETWLARITEAAPIDYDLGLEIVLCQKLIKGYSETRERGGRSFESLMQAYEAAKATPAFAAQLRSLRDTALAGVEAGGGSQGRAASG